MSQGEAGSFGDGAGKWWSVASRVLGWRPNEFWQTTPAELIAAIREPESVGMTHAPSRDLIAQMVERDQNG